MPGDSHATITCGTSRNAAITTPERDPSRAVTSTAASCITAMLATWNNATQTANTSSRRSRSKASGASRPDGASPSAMTALGSMRSGPTLNSAHSAGAISRAATRKTSFWDPE